MYHLRRNYPLILCNKFHQSSNNYAANSSETLRTCQMVLYKNETKRLYQTKDQSNYESASDLPLEAKVFIF